MPEGPYGTRTLSVSAGSATVFQGVSDFPALANGIFVNMDGALQPDGTLAATRIAVEDLSALNMFTGPLMQVGSEVPVLLVYGRQELGPLSPGPAGSGYYFDTPYFDFSSAVFQISGQLTNLQNLPFVASFNASNMVAGQNVDIYFANLALMGGDYTPANTITLVPQTINGTVVASSSRAATLSTTRFRSPRTIYFPTLAVQQGQTTLLNNPSQVEVYVDSNTQMLNTMALAPGSTLRFNGLVFNDNGTLRMDCGLVSDGVAFSSQANAAHPLESGQMQHRAPRWPGRNAANDECGDTLSPGSALDLTLAGCVFGGNRICRAFVVAGGDEFEFLQLVAQRVAADVEQAGGVGLIAIGLAHGQFDHGALHFLERRAFFRNIKPRKHASVRQLLAATVGCGAAVLEGGQAAARGFSDGERHVHRAQE